MRANQSYMEIYKDVINDLASWDFSYLLKNKVSLQTSLEINPSNLSYIFILSVNFENLTIGLQVLIISFVLTKFKEDKKLIAMSSNKC